VSLGTLNRKRRSQAATCSRYSKSREPALAIERPIPCATNGMRSPSHSRKSTSAFELAVTRLGLGAAVAPERVRDDGDVVDEARFDRRSQGNAALLENADAEPRRRRNAIGGCRPTFLR
jgi:hypothetical protein